MLFGININLKTGPVINLKVFAFLSKKSADNLERRKKAKRIKLSFWAFSFSTEVAQELLKTNRITATAGVITDMKNRHTYI